MNTYLELAVQVVPSLVVIITLIFKLVEYVQKSVKEKNWNNLLKLVLSLMQEAEKNFTDGASKKKWVIDMVKASADSINYTINTDELSKLIDNLCDMTKVVNPPIEITNNTNI